SLGAGGFADRRFHCIFLSELAPFPSGFGGDPPMGRVFIDPRQARIGFPSRAWRGRRYWCERGESNPHTEVPDPKSGASANSATFARFRRGGRIGARSRHCPRRRAPARLLGLLCDRTPLRPRRLEANSFSIRPPRKPFRRGILCLCLSFVREKPVPAFAPGRTFLSVDRLPSPRGALCLFNASSGKTLVRRLSDQDPWKARRLGVESGGGVLRLVREGALRLLPSPGVFGSREFFRLSGLGGLGDFFAGSGGEDAELRE